MRKIIYDSTNNPTSGDEIILLSNNRRIEVVSLRFDRKWLELSRKVYNNTSAYIDTMMINTHQISTTRLRPVTHHGKDTEFQLDLTLNNDTMIILLCQNFRIINMIQEIILID